MAGLDALPSKPFKENTGAGCHGAMSEMSILRYSMYGIFTYIYHTFKTNVGKYSIHAAYGIRYQHDFSVTNQILDGFLKNTLIVETAKGSILFGGGPKLTADSFKVESFKC